MEALFAYIPVVHTGTLQFLKQYPKADIFLLDNVCGKNITPYLERDMRALDAEDIKKELTAHGFISVEVLHHNNLAQRLELYERVVVPHDEIVELFMTQFAPSVQVERVNTFLRWTKQISTTEFEIPPDRKITHEQFAKDILVSLTQEAQRSPDWWRQIAAAIVQNGEIVITAHNKHYSTNHTLGIDGDPRSNLDAGEGPGVYLSIHAEAWAIAQAAKKGLSTEGADVYVTTFPCPTCARSLVEAGFKRVLYKKGYSLLDAEKILQDAGIEILLVED